MAVTLTTAGVTTVIDAPPASALSSQMAWTTVANFDSVPPGNPSGVSFNSFSQPSVNDTGLVVFRARTKAAQGGQPVRGIYTRDASAQNAPISTVAEVGGTVADPNNTGATFNEFPSFPRLDATSSDVVTRGQSTPVLSTTLPDGTTTKTGTSGVYATTGGSLETGASLLGNVPGQEVFSVPGAPAGTRFDQFPGAPSIDANTVVFKGNYTIGTSTGLTGVFYRDLSNNANAVQLIADSSTMMPGQSVPFGSTAPPSAANGQVVFTGWDNEDSPTVGGIYLADLTPNPALTPLVSIGEQVPGQSSGTTFSNFGEGLSFDGRYVAFWASWGGWKSASQSPTLTCPTDGNADLIAWCLAHDNGFVAPVPMHQGVFVYDTTTNSLTTVATDDARFAGFQYWTYSGAPPGVGGVDSSMELPHWRVSSFVAVSGLSANTGYQVAFKATTTDTATGIYVGQGPGSPSRILAVVRTGDSATGLDTDPTVPLGAVVTSLGLERDGFRNGHLALNAAMVDPITDAGWGGVYATNVPSSLAIESQSITFDAAVPAYPGDTQQLTALASSGLPVTYSVDATSGPGVCTLSGATVTFAALGTCVVAADAPSDPSYTAGHTTLAINVTKRPQTITFPIVNPAYLAESTTLSATSDSGLPVTYSVDATSGPGVCSLSGATLTYESSGSCVVDADQAGNADYAAAATVTQTISVTLRPQTITLASTPTTVYAGTSYWLTATSDAGLAVIYSLGATSTAGTCLLVGNVVTFMSTGTCVVNVDQAGTSTVAPAATVSLVIVAVARPPVLTTSAVSVPPPPLPQVITVGPAPSVTIGGTYVLAATSNSGLPVLYALDSTSTSGACTLSGATLSFHDVGVCVVSILQPGDGTHAAGWTQLRINVRPLTAALTLVMSSANLRYGQTHRARVRATLAMGVASGWVQFALNGRNVGSPVRIVGGTALSPVLVSPTKFPLWPGTYLVTAKFTPSDPQRCTSASAAVRYTVSKAVTTVHVMVRPRLVTVTVTPVSAKVTGTLTLRVANKVVGRAALRQGVATFHIVIKPSQLRLVRASYSGNILMLASSTAAAVFRP